MNSPASVCDPLLASLNEEKVITDHRTIPIIQNKFIVYPWRQQKYSLRSVSGGISWTKSWEVAFLDLDGDGVKDGLFREEDSIKESPYHVTWFIPSIDSKTVSKNSLTETEFRSVARIKNGIYLKGTHRNINFGPNFLEIVTINRKNYLLIFRAFFWTLKTESRLPFVYVVKRNTHQFLKICHFEGIVEVVRPPRF